VRLWDAFADLIAGRAVDRTMTRWGKFRPFILFFAVPLLVMSFLTFHVPTGLGDAATLLYVYLTYAVLGLLYSLVNIPYGSLASAMTQSVHQRAKLIAGRTLGAAAGSVLISLRYSPRS
jgi:glucuronide carrier protein